MTERRYRRAVIIALVIMATPLVLSLVTYATGSEKEPLLPVPTAGTQCIFERTIMRTQHMTYLKQRRDRVVRDGNRSVPAGTRVMSTCVNCHGAQSRFCDKCHSRAGVHLDCFGCHAY